MIVSEEKKRSIVEDLSPLIWKMANKMYNVEKEDLFQAGVIGVMKAIENYENDGKTKFSSYAYSWVFGEMYALCMGANDIKINKDILRLCKAIEVARNKLYQTSGKMPNLYELARFLEVDAESIMMAEAATIKMIRFESIVNDENHPYEFVADNNTIDITQKIMIDESFELLEYPDKDIMHYRYVEGYTQAEIALKLGITQTSVSRYQKRATEAMRNYMAA